MMVVAGLATACDDSPTEPAEREVLLGGLFSLTGEYAALGQTSRAAMELAVEDVNQFLAGNAAGVRFAAAVEDTRLEPQLALEKAQALRGRGVQLLIGPTSSAEVALVKPYADANDLLLVSHASTAGSLAIPGDNVYRFTPPDRLEAVAASAMMWEDGVRAVVPAWREDPGNANLAAATRTRFPTLGGAVLPGVSYGTDVQDFSATVAALRAQVEQAIAQHGSDRVAVYLAAFGEVVQLFARAADDPVLGSVRWYGSNGNARFEGLVASSQAAEFAMRVGYANPLFGLDEGARDIWEPLSERIRARSGEEPGAFTLAVYDAVWVVARAYVDSGATPDVEELKLAFAATAARHYGATGWTVLDEAGDRRHGDYDFWAIRMQQDTPRWTRVGLYESRTQRVTRWNTVRIGLQAPLTGAFAYEGSGFEKAVRLLVEQTNAAGGVDGQRVELFIEDDQGEAAAATAAAERLVARRLAAVIAGYNTAATEPAAEVYARSGLLHITPSATAPHLSTKGYPRFFRVCLTDDRLALFAAELISGSLGHRRVGVLHDNSAYARALAEATKTYLEARGVTVAFYDAIDPARQDFGPTLDAVEAANLESVYFTGYYGQAGLLLRQAGQRGLALQWLLGNASNNPEVVQIAGLENARGAIITTEPLPSDLDSPEATRFLADFHARWGEEAESVWWVMAADAYRVIEQAIRATGSLDPGRLAQYLHDELRDFPGITGTIPGFDANGDRIGAIHRAYVISATGAFVPYGGTQP